VKKEVQTEREKTPVPIRRSHDHQEPPHTQHHHQPTHHITTTLKTRAAVRPCALAPSLPQLLQLPSLLVGECGQDRRASERDGPSDEVADGRLALGLAFATFLRSPLLRPLSLPTSPDDEAVDKRHCICTLTTYPSAVSVPKHDQIQHTHTQERSSPHQSSPQDFL
jgi:hypothetical protein